MGNILDCFDKSIDLSSLENIYDSDLEEELSNIQ
mgnify:CR=1 FL=1